MSLLSNIVNPVTPKTLIPERNLQKPEPTATETKSLAPFNIVRRPWRIFSQKMQKENIPAIQMNVNPRSLDFLAKGRGVSGIVHKGRVIGRNKVNDDSGYFDVDLSFSMQTGSLLAGSDDSVIDSQPAKEPTEGHQVFASIMEMMNEDLYLSDGTLNYQTILINSPFLGAVTFKGFIPVEDFPIISEAAENPFMVEYGLNFMVLKLGTPLTNKNALLNALRAEALVG